jgi:hypothetical protein
MGETPDTIRKYKNVKSIKSARKLIKLMSKNSDTKGGEGKEYWSVDNLSPEAVKILRQNGCIQIQNECKWHPTAVFLTNFGRVVGNKLNTPRYLRKTFGW